jgi:hypothetical protein
LKNRVRAGVRVRVSARVRARARARAKARARARVRVRGWGYLEQCARDGDSLLLAAGELKPALAHARLVPLGHALDGRVDLCAARRLPDLVRVRVRVRVRRGRVRVRRGRDRGRGRGRDRVTSSSDAPWRP